MSGRSSWVGLNIFYKQSTNNITEQLNEGDLTVSVSLYKSSPERWYDVTTSVIGVNNIYIYVNK